MESEITALRAANKRLGDSLSWIVDVLLQDDEASANRDELKKNRQEALESLSYVRDVLVSGVTEVEDDRLLGEVEAARRKRVSGEQKEGSHRFNPNVPAAPTPVPVTDRAHNKPMPISTSQKSSSSVPKPFESRVADSPVSPVRKLPPWAYTPSSFGSASSLPATALPRLPPPTSSSLQRQELGPKPKSTNPLPETSVRPEAKQSETTKPRGSFDPLGVL
jgi:TBC1 domain family member 5